MNQTGFAGGEPRLSLGGKKNAPGSGTQILDESKTWRTGGILRRPGAALSTGAGESLALQR